MMRRKRPNKAFEDELARLASEVNTTEGDDPERVAAVDNQRVLKWLGERESRPAAWVWQPPKRDRLALAIIATFERHYVDTQNPAFVWAARRIAREIIPHLSGEPLRWIDAYVDEVTSSMAALLDQPPKLNVNDQIAAALRFDPAPGRGQGSAFSIARRVIRNGRLAAEVLARLEIDGKEYLAIAEVAAQNNLSDKTVGNAFRAFKAKIN